MCNNNTRRHWDRPPWKLEQRRGGTKDRQMSKIKKNNAAVSSANTYFDKEWQITASVCIQAFTTHTDTKGHLQFTRTLLWTVEPPVWKCLRVRVSGYQRRYGVVRVPSGEVFAFRAGSGCEEFAAAARTGEPIGPSGDGRRRASASAPAPESAGRVGDCILVNNRREELTNQKSATCTVRVHLQYSFIQYSTYLVTTSRLRNIQYFTGSASKFVTNRANERLICIYLELEDSTIIKDKSHNDHMKLKRYSCRGSLHKL